MYSLSIYNFNAEHKCNFEKIGFDNVNIDKENETVTFRYDTDYVIDLKTGEMTQV